MKILIVDDHEEDRYMLEVLLRGHGYEVESATDGAEALGKASQKGFDMIIADILMPRMDGFRLCREVKTNERLKKIAFVFYTATYTDPKDEEFALSLGAEKFIVKPTEPEVFIEILKEVIRSHETGTLVAPKPPVEEEVVYLKEYNERLIKKLEDKMLQMESVDRALRGSEKKYRDLIDNANDAVVVVEPTGYFSFVNPKFCEMTGYSMEEAKKLHFSKLVHPEDLAMVMENFRKRLGGEEVPSNYEVRHLTKAGKTIDIDINVSTIKKEGSIVGVLMVMRDITERKLAEKALREASEKHKELEDIVNHSPAVVFLWRAAAGWPVEFVSDNVQQFGYRSEDFYSGRVLFANIVHPDDLERVAAEVTRYSQEGRKDFTKEYRIITNTGEVRWLDDRTWVRRKSNGVITHYQGIVLDITKRKQAEQALRESETKYRELVQNANSIILRMDTHGNLTFFNEFAQRFFGYTEDEILGKNVVGTIVPEIVSSVRDIAAIIEDIGQHPERYASNENENIRKNGERVWIAWTNKAITDEEGRIVEILCVGNDITSRKRAEDEKEKLQAQLQQTQKMEAIGTLAGGIAHDLNNILASIFGYTELASLDVPEGSKAKKDLKEVLKAGHRAKDLVRQILAFSRQSEEERKPVQIGPIVKETLKLLRASLPTTIEIREHIDKDIGIVHADPTQIHQVLMNLCTNAAHAMNKKGGTLEVSLRNVSIVRRGQANND